MARNNQNIIATLCEVFYEQGWATGTGGGMAIRENGKLYLPPTGVHKEMLTDTQIFEIDEDTGTVIKGPTTASLSECYPIYKVIFANRPETGAIIHSHGQAAVLATLLYGSQFIISKQEMIKGIAGLTFDDTLVVPIIENTPREAQLTDRIGQALVDYPDASAVLIRRHGMYCWGSNWSTAKRHAECYHYLFDMACRMLQYKLDPS